MKKRSRLILVEVLVILGFLALNAMYPFGESFSPGEAQFVEQYSTYVSYGNGESPD